MKGTRRKGKGPFARRHRLLLAKRESLRKNSWLVRPNCSGGQATPDVFISYARGDAALARQFAEAFAEEGLDVWWDDALRAGEVFDETIERALRSAKAVVVLWSPRSVVSRWVRAEATIGDRNATLMPCMIEPCERPVIFELTHTADLCGWKGDKQDTRWQDYLGHVCQLVAGETSESRQASGSRSPGPAALRDKPRVALLPIRSSPQDAEFAQELTEEAIAGFGRFSYALMIVEQADTAQFRIEGQFGRVGDKARLSLRLIDVGTGRQALAERLLSTESDPCAAQEELATQLVAHVAQAVEDSETAWAIGQSGERISAYHRLLVGLRSVREFSPEGLTKARDVLEGALEEAPLDPYLLSLASLTNSLLLFFRVAEDREKTAAAAREFMRRSLIAGGDDPQVLGWATVGGVYSGGDLSHIETLIDRALERNPGWSFLWNFNASVKLLKGDAQTALERVDKALELDGWSVDRWAMLSTRGGALAMLGRFEEAHPACTEAVALVPTGMTALGLVHSLVGLRRWEDAREAARLLPADVEIEIGYFRSPQYREMIRDALQELEGHAL